MNRTFTFNCVDVSEIPITQPDGGKQIVHMERPHGNSIIQLKGFEFGPNNGLIFQPGRDYEISVREL